jgi:lipid-binding SYLF domain-containing protein
MKSTLRLFPHCLLLFSALVAAVPAAQAKKTADEQRAAIKQTRDDVLAELYKLNPAAQTRIKKAAGYAVFTNVGVNLVLASFAGGHGIVVEKGMIRDTETYMKMGSAGLGLGLGVKDFRAVFVFDDAAKLRAFVEKGWDFSGQADAAAKSNEKGGAVATAGNIAEGVAVYQITKNGLALQATLQGTKYWKDQNLN